MRAQLGASRPKSLLQGIINSGVSQGRLVFIKRRQLNAVAALQCYNWKADWDDVHQEGPAPRHRGGMGGQGQTRTGPLHAIAQPGVSRPCQAYMLWMGNKGLGGKQRKKEGTCPRPADSQELSGCLPGSPGADCTVSLLVHGKDNSVASTGPSPARPPCGEGEGTGGCSLGIWK